MKGSKSRLELDKCPLLRMVSHERTDPLTCEIQTSKGVVLCFWKEYRCRQLPHCLKTTSRFRKGIDFFCNQIRKQFVPFFTKMQAVIPRAF